MAITFGKILSLVIAIAYVAFILVCEITSSHSVSCSAAGICAIVLLPLALIWFPETIGEAKGFIGHGYVDAETPAALISFMGWFFLVGMPLILLLIAIFGGA